jgi:hypothetical protein
MRSRLTTAALVSLAALTAATVTLPASPAAASGPAQRGQAIHDDFDGDGYGDLAVGMPGAPVAGKAAAGYIVVVYGSAQGLDPRRRQILHQSNAQIPGTAESGDHFGSAITSADLDQDGYADLVTSSTYENLGTNGRPGFVEGAGSVTIVWGGAGGLRGGTAVNGLSDNDGLGASLTAADFDGDGRPDLGIAGAAVDDGTVWLARGPFRPGAPHNTPVRLARTPFGAPDVTVASGDTDGDGTAELVTTWIADRISATRLYRWDGVAMTQSADLPGGGRSGAVADFDRDGYDDIAVGLWHDIAAEPTPTQDGGRIKVVYGSPEGPGAGRASTFIDQDTPGVPGTDAAPAEWSDNLGQSLSAADTNRDGYPDLAAGVPGEDDYTGRVVVLFGGKDGLTGRGARSYHQDSPGIPGAGERQDRFGWQVRIVGAGRDRFPQLAVSASGEDNENGRIWTLPGTSSGPSGNGARAYDAGALRLPAPTDRINLGLVLPR